MAFVKATKKQSKLRLALCGVSGSGKTYTALLIAKHLGKRVAVIDTERGSASKYAGDVADFDVCELTSFAPAKYIQALKDAAAEGFDVVVIDSLSHGWMGTGGIIDQKDKKGGNSFDAWRTLTPQHNDFVEAILSYPGHVIATMRSKTEYVVEVVNGKSVPRKIGMAPVQRDGVEYEFDVVGDLDADHVLHCTKSRCAALAGEYIRAPGEQVARALLAWLEQGDAVDVEAVRAAAAAKLAADEAAAKAEAEAKAAADAKSREKAAASQAEIEARKAAELASVLDRVDDLAEEMIACTDAEALARLVDKIGDTRGNTHMRNGLTALSEKRAAALAGQPWAAEQAARALAEKHEGRVEKRQAARAAANAPTNTTTTTTNAQAA